MNRLKPHAALNAVSIASALLLAGCDKPAPIPVADKVVLVTTVHPSSQTEQRSFTATVRAQVESEIAFRTGGKVVKRLVDVGDRVSAGQVLAQLDGTDHALAVRAASDQVRAATVDAEQAASDAARFMRLAADGSVGAADHERQKARADAAAARLDQAKRQLDLARNRETYATLVAPYSGVVTGVRAEVGQVVTEGQPVVALAREGSREIVADVPEQLATQLRALKATASPWQRNGEALALELCELSPVASAQGRTFQARYVPASAARAVVDALPLGSTAQLQLAATGSLAFVLPVSAVIKSNDAASVWTITGTPGALTLIPVKINSFEADQVRVTGLADGARVVTVGAQKLDKAMKVRAVERNAESDGTVVGRSGT